MTPVRLRQPYVVVVHDAARTESRPDDHDTVVQAAAVVAALRRLGFRCRRQTLDADLRMVGDLTDADVVFNGIEAVAGDARLAAAVPALLRRLGIPCTGSDAVALYLGADKPRAKRLMRAAGLPTPDWSPDPRSLPADAAVIVKSAHEHASLGLDAGSVIAAGDAAAVLADRTARFGGTWFAECYVDGREFNVSLLATRGGVSVLPIAEIAFVDFPVGRPRIVDYEAKWSPGSFGDRHTPRRFAFSPADSVLMGTIADFARTCWDLLGLAGYARVDFRVDADGRPWLVDINPNPCLAPDSGFVAAAAVAGLDYDAVIACIVAAAGADDPTSARW